jgi:hypothetical protein
VEVRTNDFVDKDDDGDAGESDEREKTFAVRQHKNLVMDNATLFAVEVGHESLLSEKVREPNSNVGQHALVRQLIHLEPSRQHLFRLFDFACDNKNVRRAEERKELECVEWATAVTLSQANEAMECVA